MKRAIPVIVAVVVSIILAIIGVFTGVFKGGTSRNIADLYENFNLKDEDGSNLDSIYAAIVFNNELKEDRAINKDGKFYFTLAYVDSDLNGRFFWDEKDETLLYTMPDGTDSYGKDDPNIYIGKDDTIYISTEIVAKYTNVAISTYENPSRVVLDNQWDVPVKHVKTKSNTMLRDKNSDKGDILKNCASGEELAMSGENEDGDYVQVTSNDGITGFISKTDIGDAFDYTAKSDFEEQIYDGVPFEGGLVSMAWHQIAGTAGNITYEELTANMKGVNVISPTWFTFTSKKGEIQSFATQEYVDQAHSDGLKVWALFDDFSQDENGNRYVDYVLPYSARRKSVIKQVVAELKKYNIDGLNIDFEYIKKANAANYVQFIRELGIACHKAGKTLSIDNYVTSAWTKYYNRKEQGVFADYVVIMGYDEHTVGSEEAGSVASIGFVKKGIEGTIKEVGDRSKVINGVPFYCRIWDETPEAYAGAGSTIIQDEVNGNYALATQAVDMNLAKETVQNNGGVFNWVEEVGQYYAEYPNGYSTERVWLEDDRSIEEKLKLINKYKIGGAAYWKLGFEDASVWDVVEKYLK